MGTNYASYIRNFAIIAHIDHGKSTLADRLLSETGTIALRDMKDRVLDTLELEQERGITIKLQTARMSYEYSGDNDSYVSKDPYILNLIDTPGHVDFSYEVSRSIASCEAAILLVDATQGIQAQTLTTVYKALEYDLEIIPAINKVDLPSAQVEKVTDELINTFGFSKEEIILTSGKSGIGVSELLNAIIERCPAPTVGVESKQELDSKPPRMMIYDSFYHEHKGVVVLVKMVDGKITEQDNLFSIGSGEKVEPIEIGYMRPIMEKQKELLAGEVGYIATGLKDIKLIHVGDTLTTEKYRKGNIEQLPGYQPPKAMVYASLFPVEANDFEEFSQSLEKLALNDAALSYQREHSLALGSGYLCGFLGLLHLEITQERLEKEFDIDLISTSPTVDYKVWLTTKDMSKVPMLSVAQQNEDDSFNVRTAGEFPDPTLIEKVEEPWVRLEVLTPDEYIGNIMELCQNHRGEYKRMEYISSEAVIEGKKHVILKYEIPTAEIITTFFDTLKSATQGYATMDYEFIGYREADIVKVGVLVNSEDAGALSFLTHRDKAERRGRDLVKKLKELIPRQQFKVPIQAAIGGKVIARETIQAYRKDVTAKLYGGDVTRKKKLLEKQKKGKKRLKSFGSVEIPKEAFLGALRVD
ncbi:translation elongation factor 4 [Candidatus Dojkabacteria bacterium]|uniref:Elongation factor 4 n=1 Tax=Candidatus Dojkabacteria bacterium TaxID=2099670 RepID=A0A955L8Q7_9BACT|nr:translation elongation factor 4 [Candidatus Dojkabacteria bacterium]